jgi:hypothetical protein
MSTEQKKTPPPEIPYLSACPECSHASPGLVALILRPQLVHSWRSGRYFIVNAAGCSHGFKSIHDPENSSDCPVKLANRWNAWAEKKAALVCERRGMTPERAKFFRAALLDPKR